MYSLFVFLLNIGRTSWTISAMGDVSRCFIFQIFLGKRDCTTLDMISCCRNGYKFIIVYSSFSHSFYALGQYLKLLQYYLHGLSSYYCSCWDHLSNDDVNAACAAVVKPIVVLFNVPWAQNYILRIPFLGCSSAHWTLSKYLQQDLLLVYTCWTIIAFGCQFTFQVLLIVLC